MTPIKKINLTERLEYIYCLFNYFIPPLKYLQTRFAGKHVGS
jgi:hypothetical protein